MRARGHISEGTIAFRLPGRMPAMSPSNMLADSSRCSLPASGRENTVVYIIDNIGSTESLVISSFEPVARKLERGLFFNEEFTLLKIYSLKILIYSNDL